MQLSAALGHPDHPHFPHPPPPPPPPPAPSPPIRKKKKSPSQLRRQERRRQEALARAEEVSSPINVEDAASTDNAEVAEKDSSDNVDSEAYRTNYRIIPFLVTNVINYVIFENTMAIM